MIIKPKVRGFVCVTAHPDGCAAHVQQQIEVVKARAEVRLPAYPGRGCSTAMLYFANMRLARVDLEVLELRVWWGCQSSAVRPSLW